MHFSFKVLFIVICSQSTSKSFESWPKVVPADNYILILEDLSGKGVAGVSTWKLWNRGWWSCCWGRNCPCTCCGGWRDCWQMGISWRCWWNWGWGVRVLNICGICWFGPCNVMEKIISGNLVFWVTLRLHQIFKKIFAFSIEFSKVSLLDKILSKRTIFF